MSATRRIWPICCGWVGCRTLGSPRRKPGNCASWSGIGPNSSGCDPNLQGRSTRGTGLAGDRGSDGRPVRGRGKPARTGHVARAVQGRIASLRRLIDRLDSEIDRFAGLVPRRLPGDPGYAAVQQIPGIGPVLAAVFGAEIGDVHRFARPAPLTSWAGLTPAHRESDTTARRGRITKQGSHLVRWAAIEAVKIRPETSRIGAIRERWPTAAATATSAPSPPPETARARLLRPARPPRPPPAPHTARGMTTGPTVGAGRASPHPLSGEPHPLIDPA